MRKWKNPNHLVLGACGSPGSEAAANEGPGKSWASDLCVGRSHTAVLGSPSRSTQEFDLAAYFRFLTPEKTVIFDEGYHPLWERSPSARTESHDGQTVNLVSA